MNCFICGQFIVEGDEVIATVRAKFHRDSGMADTVHALEVIEELTLEHEECPEIERN